MDLMYIAIAILWFIGFSLLLHSLILIRSVYKALYVIKNGDRLEKEWNKAVERLQELEKVKDHMTRDELIVKARLIKESKKLYSWGVFLDSDVRKIMHPPYDLLNDFKTGIPPKLNEEESTNLLLKEFSTGMTFLIVGFALWLVVIILACIIPYL